jgi:hypothetical protein
MLAIQSILDISTHPHRQAAPEADVNWASKKMKVKVAITGDSLPQMGDNFELFNV